FDFYSRGSAFGATPRPLGRQTAQRGQSFWIVVSELCSRSNFNFVFRDQAWIAAGLWGGNFCASRVTRRHHGQRSGRNSYSHGAHLDARRTRPRLRSHRPRQRIARTSCGLSPRAPQCYAPDHHRTRPAIWRIASWGHRDRKDFFLARNRAFDHRRDRQSRLLPGAGMYPRHRADLRSCELFDRFVVLGSKPADQTVKALVCGFLREPSCTSWLALLSKIDNHEGHEGIPRRLAYVVLA